MADIVKNVKVTAEVLQADGAWQSTGSGIVGKITLDAGTTYPVNMLGVWKKVAKSWAQVYGSDGQLNRDFRLTFTRQGTVHTVWIYTLTKTAGAFAVGCRAERPGG